MGDAVTHDVLRAPTTDVLAFEQHAPMPRCKEAGDGPKSGRLASAIGADERDHLSTVNVETDFSQRLDLTVEDVDLLDFKQMH
jgi:hypothetical protein